MPVEIKPLDPNDTAAWWGVLSSVFVFDLRPEDQAVRDGLIDWDLALAAHDGDSIVGTVARMRLEMTVPGGAAVPMSGLTTVAVLPSHRRRGVLTSLTRRALESDRDVGVAVSALWASESAIYGRFGYGTAVEGADLELDRAHTGMVVDSPARGRVRIVAAEEARRIVPGLYAAATAGIPGTISRREQDWDRYFHDPEHWREGYSSLRIAVCEADGELRGYAVHRLKGGWEEAHPRYTARIKDLQAMDADSYAALFRFCLGLDLVETFEISNRRVHEPLVHLLADPRRLRSRITDKIWLRFVDLAAALRARCYGVDGDLVLAVRDDFCPWVEGRYELRGGPDGAECEPTGREADVSLSSADLASSYLGTSRIPVQAWLGRVAGDPEAIGLLHRMLSWPAEPWCSVFF